MKDIVNNKNYRMATIVAGAVSLFFVIQFFGITSTLVEGIQKEGVFGLYSDIGKVVLGQIRTIVNIYYLMAFLSVALVGVGAYIKFQLKAEDESTLPLLSGNGISTVLLLANVKQVGVIKKLTNIESFDFSNLSGISSDVSFKNFTVLLVLAILIQLMLATMAFSFEWFIRKNRGSNSTVSNIPQLNKSIPNIPSLPKKSKMEKISELKENAIAYSKTEKGKKAIALAMLGVVGLGALFGFSSVLQEKNKPVINLTENCELKIEGYEGTGSAYPVCSIDTNREDLTKVQKDALYAIYFDTPTKQGSLKNGDKVHVKAVYNKEDLEEVGLKFSNTERDLKVKGLQAVYTKYADISKDDQNKIEEASYGLVKANFDEENSDYDRYTEEGHEQVAKYFVQEGATSKVVYIYRIDYLHESRILKSSEFSNAEKEHSWYQLTFDNLNPEKELVADSSSNDISVKELYNPKSNNGAIKSVKSDLEEVDDYYEDVEKNKIEILVENKSDETYQ